MSKTKKQFKHSASTRRQWREQGARRRARQATARSGTVAAPAAAALASPADPPARKRRGKAAEAAAEVASVPAADVAADVAQAMAPEVAQATGAATTAADAAAPAVDAATVGAATCATVPDADPRQPCATDGAMAHAAQAPAPLPPAAAIEPAMVSTGEASAVPPLRESLATSLTTAAGLAIGGAATWKSYGMLCGLMEYLNPGYGVDVAMSLVLGEAAGGLFLETRLAARRRDAWTWLLLLAVVIFPASQSMLACVREVGTHATHVKEATHEATVTTQCVDKDPPPDYGKTRLPIWQEGERQRMADCHAQQEKERREGQATLTKATDEHSVFELPVMMLLPVGLSIINAATGAAISVLFRSLLSIPAGLLALFRRRVSERAQEPKACPDRPMPTGLPLTLPPPPERWWRRLAHWPVLRALMRRRVAA
jgi:hypothetical protein